MCGIAGIFMNDASEKITTVLNQFKHRGPDETTEYGNEYIVFGSNRLSINDITNGSQPFKSEKSICFYNGEIYNHKEIRKFLKNKGYKLKTDVDGEVIPYLYDLFGLNYTQYLDGMYAISIYDRISNSLILSRDLVGEKPLFYSVDTGKRVYFSSSLSSFNYFKSLKISLNFQSMWDFPTFLWIPEPSTIYNEVLTLNPGQTIKFNQKHSVTDKFEKIQVQDLTSLNQYEKIELVRETITESVHSTLMSDVPIGTFLSSGLDSSIVTKLSTDKISNLHTFSVAFPDDKDPYHDSNNNEAPEAKIYSETLGTTHSEINLDYKNVKEELVEFVKYSEQPFSVSSGIGIKLISKKASELGIKVLLSGDGADELFGGYSWYLLLEEIFKIRNIQTKYQESQKYSLQNYESTDSIRNLAALSNSHLTWALHYYASELEKKSLFSESFSAEMKSSLRLFENLDKKGNDLKPIDLIINDREFYLSQEMMRKMDRMTMAHSIEGRVPFVRKKVLELAQSLNYSDLVSNGKLKVTLREAFRKELPSRIISKDKHGFNFPIDKWLNNEWKDLVFSTFSTDSVLYKLGIIDKYSLKKALEMNSSCIKRNGHTLFSFIILDLWLQTQGKGKLDC